MNSLNDIWAEVMKALEAQLTPTAISTWFSDCECVSIDNGCLYLKNDSAFKRQIICDRFGDTIRAVLSDIFSGDFTFKILSEEEANELTKPQDDDGVVGEMAGYTFDRFVVGPSNKFAHAAAMAVAEHPGENYNPLFIYGNSGLGKTHLLLSIGQYIHEHFPKKRIEYIKGDDFTNDMVDSLRRGNMDEFRTRFRNVDLLLVDDIQFIAGKRQTQDEFFHTFNNNYEAGHQIVITSDRPPMEMSLLDDRLRTRFEGGLMADIAPPDFETRMAIIRNKASQLGLILPDDIIKYIAEKVTDNVRKLEGVIKKLTAFSRIMDEDIDLWDIIDSVISQVQKDGEFVPKPDVIIRETARYFSIRPEDLRGQNRTKNILYPRQISMYLMRILTNMSLNDIGAEFENRNHSTVLSSIRKIEDMIKDDPDTAAIIQAITSNITS